MAASSSGNSLPLVLRITYDELVAYADELEKKKDKKQSKKKSHEKSKEKGLKSEKEVDKNGSSDVSGKYSPKKTEQREECETINVSKRDKQKSKDVSKKDAKKDKRNSKELKPKRKSSVEKEDSAVRDNGIATDDNKKASGSKQKDTRNRGSVSRKEVSDDDVEKECNDYELELRARTGGVLKLSNSKSPDEGLEGSLKDDVKHCQPRGIIKLPEGLDLTEKDEEKEIRQSHNSPKKRSVSESRGFFDSVHSHDTPSQRQEVKCSDGSDSEFHANERKTGNSIAQENVYTSEGQSIKRFAEYHNGENAIVAPEPNSSAKVEKKVKSLHLQRAQKLLKLVAQREASLSNLLSREILDKAAFEKINSISKEIQDACKGVMMLDLSFAIQQEVDQNLWRNGFYKVIETLRKYGKLFLGYADKTEMLSPEEINNCLKEFLANAETFYKNILELLQKDHEVSVQDVVSQPRKAEKLGKKVRNYTVIARV